jgi:chromate transporter
MDTPSVAPWLLFRLWAGIGAQSFGGGHATAALIRQTFVEQREWISEEEFARAQGICQPVPGMNLLAITILLGARFGGTAGIFLSLFGLLLPSVTLALIITAFFSQVRENASVQSALRNGVIPATVGIGLYSTFRNAVALLREGRQEGRSVFVLSLCLIAAAMVLAAATSLPVFALFAGAGVIGAAATLWRARPSAALPESTAPPSEEQP